MSQSTSTSLSKCRQADCVLATTPYSVYCKQHLVERLQALGVTFTSLSDRVNKLWERHKRGLFSDEESALFFFELVEAATVEAAFDSLPIEFQSLICSYLRRTPPEAIPSCSFIGSDQKVDVVEAANALRQRCAQTLLDTRCAYLRAS